MTDIEVHIDLEGQTHPVDLARSNKVRGGERAVFDAPNGSAVHLLLDRA